MIRIFKFYRRFMYLMQHRRVFVMCESLIRRNYVRTIVNTQRRRCLVLWLVVVAVCENNKKLLVVDNVLSLCGTTLTQIGYTKTKLGSETKLETVLGTFFSHLCNSAPTVMKFLHNCDMSTGQKRGGSRWAIWRRPVRA